LKSNWINLNLKYIGPSKKSEIFRAKKFKEGHFGINSPVFNKELNKIGVIKDIFGPVESPFVSIHADLKKKSTDFDFSLTPLYTKLKKSRN